MCSDRGTGSAKVLGWHSKERPRLLVELVQECLGTAEELGQVGRSGLMYIFSVVIPSNKIHSKAFPH